MSSLSPSRRLLLVVALVCLSLCAMAAGLPEGSVSVTNVSPNNGDVAGGTSVTITGTGFAGGATVTFGGTAATGVSVVNATSISCATPAHTPGAVTVTVTNTDTSGSSLPNGFTYTTSVPAPSVSSVNPTSGPTTGGTSVTITGLNFVNGATVTFGGAAASGVSFGGSTSLTCTTPSHAAGAVDVVVTNPDTQSGTLTSGFTYTASAPAPTVSSVNPTSGPTTGGTSVTITGSNFVSGATVTFGGTTATGVSVGSASSITCTTPSHAAGAVDVVVTNLDAQTGTLPSGFTYTAGAPAPTVSAVNPISGPTAGSTSVTITGTNFVNGATVSFGGTAATGVSFGSSTSLTCTTPAHGVGAVNVVVTNPDAQTGTLTNGYTYTSGTPAPTVTSVAPSSGPVAGGTDVTITGTNFVNGATVAFGGTSAKSTFVNSTSLTCSTPAHAAGAVDVVVTNPDAQSGTLKGGFTYAGSTTAPLVTLVSPNSGPVAGATPVTVTGGNFVNGATITFDGSSATAVTFVSANSITCATPAHAAGSVNVVVTNPDTQSGTLFGGFTYTSTAPAPKVTNVSPPSGPVTGGTSVTVTGANFVNGAAIYFAGTAATGVSFLSSTSLACTTPAHGAGAADVAVTNPDAQSGILPGGFTYEASPCKLSCTAKAPSSGQAGTAVAFTADVVPTDCTGQPAYQWTFGDGTTSNEQNPSHIYTTSSAYSWSFTATLEGTYCTEYGSIAISPRVPPPVITDMAKATNPFRLKVYGSNFHLGCTVKVNGAPVPTTKYKSGSLVVAKSGSALKAMLPLGVPVQITVTNNDDGGVSTPFYYVR